MTGIKFLIFGVILALAGIFFVLLAGSEGFGGIFGLVLVVCGFVFGMAGLLCSDVVKKSDPKTEEKSEVQSDSSNDGTPDSEK